MAPATVLHPTRGKTVLFLAISLVFTAIGCLELSKGEVFMGCLTVFFFGLAVVVFIVNLRPSASWLRLQDDGFIYCSLFRKSPLIRWTEVSAFRVADVAGREIVVFDWSLKPRSGFRRFNRVLGGASDGLPDTYGLKAEALAGLLNQWRCHSR